ncbi:MAG: cyclic nucleotide-binding domain-containing protein [Candidatus Parcubacteria bacterium]|nr:cyclic nucleotide-binding domain-containing protein [Burkholderiales bacterium]
MANPHAAALKEMALCRSLTAAELEAIAAIAETLDVAAGKSLFREGDPGDGLFLVVAGEIDVIKRGPRGDRSLARLGPGGVLGEMSLITDDVRSATGRALVDTRVLRLPVRFFRMLRDQGSPAALKIVAAIAEVLAHRLAAMNVMVLELADEVDPAGSKLPALKDTELAELHRTMQVWSF